MGISRSAAVAHERGAALYDEYHRTGNVLSLETAIASFREAVDATPTSDPGRPATMSNLGTALLTRFGHSAKLADLGQAIALLADLAKRPGSLGNAHTSQCLDGLYAHELVAK